MDDTSRMSGTSRSVVVALGQQRRRHQLEHAVLGPGDPHLAQQPRAPDHPECLHTPMVGRRAGCAPRPRTLGRWSTSRASTPGPATTARPRSATSRGYGKNDLRLVAYADADEANSALGVALALGDLPDGIARPAAAHPERPVRRRRGPVHARRGRTRSTRRCGSTAAYVDAPRGGLRRVQRATSTRCASFILPGGTAGSALLHVARTVVTPGRALDLGGPRGSPRHRMNR